MSQQQPATPTASDFEQLAKHHKAEADKHDSMATAYKTLAEGLGLVADAVSDVIEIKFNEAEALSAQNQKAADYYGKHAKSAASGIIVPTLMPKRPQ